MLRIVAWIVLLLVFCFTVVLTIPNTHLVTLNYYVGSTEIHLTVLLLISLCVGALLGSLFNLMWVWKVYRDNQRLRKLYKQMLHEVDGKCAYSKQSVT
jgi:uncharacterized integral membrane protein